MFIVSKLLKRDNFRATIFSLHKRRTGTLKIITSADVQFSAQTVYLEGLAFFRGGLSLKLSTKAADFKKVCLLIGRTKHVNWGGRLTLSRPQMSNSPLKIKCRPQKKVHRVRRRPIFRPKSSEDQKRSSRLQAVVCILKLLKNFRGKMI